MNLLRPPTGFYAYTTGFLRAIPPYSPIPHPVHLFLLPCDCKLPVYLCVILDNEFTSTTNRFLCLYNRFSASYSPLFPYSPPCAPLSTAMRLQTTRISLCNTR